MSTDDRHPELEQAEDVIPSRAVLLTTALSVAVTVALIVIAYVLLQARETQLRGTHDFPDRNLPAPHARSQVLAEPFGIPRARPPLTTRKRAIIDGWGWVDRNRGVVHIPVEEAMDLLLQENKRP